MPRRGRPHVALSSAFNNLPPARACAENIHVARCIFLAGVAAAQLVVVVQVRNQVTLSISVGEAHAVTCSGMYTRLPLLAIRPNLKGPKVLDELQAQVMCVEPGLFCWQDTPPSAQSQRTSSVNQREAPSPAGWRSGPRAALHSTAQQVITGRLAAPVGS